ncbi:hypothetical protein [Neobacillus ginsengisoli]|uniref:Fic family protein n=1 Tax=Neobacillus ginsengisoli TaxID=904295 RepID=A0ABT9XYH9_9BACI|nr:hypothetical protein [Neobacillus ginsengisoli]MDQ0200544.1 Fic family protein [Neobacillus ginsengisoli]
MEKDQAIYLSNYLEEWSGSSFEINKLKTVGGTLPKFHQWTNGKKTLAGYEVTRPDHDIGYYLLFIDWHRNENYYLVIYAHDKSTTIAEMRQIEEIDGIFHLVWKYNPLKRDGKNDQRKAYFKQTFGTTTVQIKIPSSSIEVEAFISQLFKLCQNRMKADQIVEVFDFENGRGC